MIEVISLGSACQVRYHIDRYYDPLTLALNIARFKLNHNFQPKSTHFFDWLITDFRSVLYVLKYVDDSSIITRDKFTDEQVYMSKENVLWPSSHHKIEHKEFKMVSVHDCPDNRKYTETIDDMVEKYKRRLKRLKDLICSNNIVHMIHCIDHQYTEPYIISSDDIKCFFEHLNKINPSNKCKLHIVIPPKYNSISTEHLIHDNVFIYYLTEKQKGDDSDWTNSNFDWDAIFDNIKKLEQKKM